MIASCATFTCSFSATRFQYSDAIAATVVSTWSLNVRSETSRLLRAMWICRELIDGPKPCNSRCVICRFRLEFVSGLMSLRGLLLVDEVLFSPRLTVVPVRKPFWMPKLPTFCSEIRDVVPVMNVLLCGVVWCAQLMPPVSTGSSVGIDGPDDCSTLPPTAESVAELVCEADVLVAPGTVPAAFTVALDGPAVTLVETPRAKPPAIGLQQIGLGDHRVVPLDRDVQVVFERQRDRILKRQVEVSGAQKLLQPVRVRHVDRRHLLRPVRRLDLTQEYRLFLGDGTGSRLLLRRRIVSGEPAGRRHHQRGTY